MTSSFIIKRLQDNVINQIKAGEVIERPFNIVKELIENSLDASATNIKIELFDGGKRFIRVSDNGCGIPYEFIRVAVDRHTTSKLESFEDLESLKTFGFRGEALASIASVSKFSLKTKTQADDVGHEIIFENGFPAFEQTISMTTGTVMTIKDIFQNVPARLKFLRSTATEFTLIQDFITAMSLYHAHISFQLMHNGRIVFDYKAQKSKSDRFKEIMGAESEHYTELNYERGHFSLSGFAILPDKIRASHNSIITFVNDRFVKDKLVRSGIYDGYRGLLMKGVTPSVMIFIQVDPKTIDINAHPSKTEIRFYDPLMVQDFIARGIENALKTKLNEGFYEDSKCPEYPTEFTEPVKTLNCERQLKVSTISMETSNYERQFTSDLNIQDTAIIKTQSETLQTQKIQNVLFTPIKKNGFFSNVKFLNQFAKCYLIFEYESELWFVDQHAFHERILFEEIQSAYKKNKIGKQMLLNPVLISINQNSAHIYEENKELIDTLGFEIEILKNDTIAVHSVPVFLNQKYIESAFTEITEKLFQQEILNSELFYHHCFSTIACHSAIRSGESLNEDFVIKLVNRSNDVNFFAHCPHGRPVIRKFTQNDVAKWFERI